jgi:hypothetical protein
LRRDHKRKQNTCRVLQMSTFATDSMRTWSEVENFGAHRFPLGACSPELLQWLVGFCSKNHNLDCWRQCAFLVLLFSTFSPNSIRTCRKLPKAGSQVSAWVACPPELLHWLVGVCSKHHNPDCWRHYTFLVLLFSTFSPNSIRICRRLPKSGTQVSAWVACPPELLQWLVGFYSKNHNPDCWRQNTFLVLLFSTFSPNFIRRCRRLPNAGSHVCAWVACTRCETSRAGSVLLSL